MMNIKLLIVLGLLANFCFAHGSNEKINEEVRNTSYEVAGAENHPFFQALRHTRMNRTKLSTAEIIQKSEVIVRGHIVSITDGRVLEHPRDGASGPLRTALIKVRASKTLKGDVGDYVYFEYIRGGIPAEYYEERKYPEEILLFLRKPGWDESVYTIHNSPDGLMHEVDSLYELTSDSSLLIEKIESDGVAVDRVVQPLDAEDPQRFGKTFSQIEAFVESGGENGFIGLMPPSGTHDKDMSLERMMEEYIRTHGKN